MNAISTNLAGLRPGDRARITAVTDVANLGARLGALGILPHSDVSVLNVAPFGDPLTIRVGSQSVALRRRDAVGILVEQDQ